MGIEIIFLGLALAMVGIFRGSYRQLFRTKVNHWWALIPVLIGQLIIEFAPIKESQYDTVGISVLLATYVFLFGFLWANLNLKAMWVALVGLSLNAIVIALNLGMPVTTSGGYRVVESIKHQSATDSDILGFLSDIIPINFASIAISIGDIIFALGICAVFVFASRVNEEQRLESDTEDFEVITSDSKEQLDLEEVKVVDISKEEKLEENNEKATPKMMPSRPLAARKKRKWRKTHGLSALPTKEELGFDEDSMEIVDIAK